METWRGSCGVAGVIEEDTGSEDESEMCDRAGQNPKNTERRL